MEKKTRKQRSLERYRLRTKREKFIKENLVNLRPDEIEVLFFIVQGYRI